MRIRSYWFIPFFLPVIVLGQISDTEDQEQVKTTLEVFEDIIASQLERFLYYPGLDRELPFVFSVNHAEGGRNEKENENEEGFIISVVKKTAQNNNLKFSLVTGASDLRPDSAVNSVSLQIYTLQTKYTGFRKNKFLGEKSLERNIRVKIAIGIFTSNGKFELKDFITSDYRDEINFEEYKKLESPKYRFTRGRAPEVGYLERIIVPAAFVIVSAAVIVMFFVLRTK